MLGDIDNWWKSVASIAGEALNFIGYLFYAIFTGVGMLINFVLSLFKQLAGIEAMTLTAGNKYITVGGEGNWTDITYAFITSDAVRTTFWTIFAMCIALLVVFTIFAIVKSEFSTDVKNAAKLPILERAVKSVINFLLIPVLSLASLYGANMLTKAVYYSFNTNSEYYITNVIFNAGGTQANRVSLNNGFANYLLSTNTIYFAKEDKVSSLESMTAMLNKYFAADGYITVQKWRGSSVIVGGVIEEATTTAWNGSPIWGGEGSNLYHIDDLIAVVNNEHYQCSNGERAGLCYFKPDDKTGNEYKTSDKVWYEWIIQAPIDVTYKDKSTGFLQTIPRVFASSVDKCLLLGYGTGASTDRLLYSPFDDLTTAAIIPYFGKNTLKTTITQSDIDGWWKDSSKFQRCVSGFSSEDYTSIINTINAYASSIGALSIQDTVEGELAILWEILQAEYNTEGNIIYGTQPTPNTEAEIQTIKTEQRSLLADFVDQIFVGEGDGKGAYCKYAVWQSGSSGFTLKTKDEMNKMVQDAKISNKTTIDEIESDEKLISSFKKSANINYLEISSRTLHVEMHSRKTIEEVYSKTSSWTVDYTPDAQQYFWSPSTYSGEAVMDMGLVGYFYKFNNMNLVMMLFGMVAIAWQYFKLILVFVKRALEMVLLFLMAPVVTAIAPLDKGNAENSWRSNWIKQLTMTAVPVFAINIFFTIVPLVSSLQMFKTTNPLALTYNAFVSIIFIYVGVSMINRASQLLAGFLGTEDMIVQGKDLTGKATGVVGTAAKGAALVTGVALAGPAAAIKAGMSMKSGRKARKDSLIQSRKDALSDIDDQIKEAKEAGDSDRVFQLERYRDNYDSYKANSAGGQQFSKAQKDKALEKLSAAQKAKESDEADLAKLRAEQESLASVPMQMGRQKKWNAEEKKAWEDKKADVAARIAQKQSDIAEKNAAIADAQRQSQYYANDERFYSNFTESQKTAKSVGKEARSAAWKKLNKDGFVKDLEEKRENIKKKPGWKELDSAISHIPGVNWAVNKVLWNAAGLAAQVADRKFFADTPKVAMDFVKGVSGDAGKIAEKFIDPGTIGKVISTEEDNKFRDTVKEEKARRKAWEEQMKFEDDKLNKQKKAQEELETKRQLREYERYKMGAFDVQDGKLNINAKNAETIAKNYEKTIDQRADQDFKNNVQKDDQNFAKFKQMLKEMEDENKKKAQNVKIDPRDKGFGEQVINAMKTVNAQNNRELKNITSGIGSLTGSIDKLVEELKKNK